MQQAYVTFSEQSLRRMKGGAVKELFPQGIPCIQSSFSLDAALLPPCAEAYFSVMEQAGFIGEGDPLLALEHIALQDLGKEDYEYEHRLFAHWPRPKGIVAKDVDKLGYVGTVFTYNTDAMSFEVFEALKDKGRLRDFQRSDNYNTINIPRMLPYVPWKAHLEFFVKRLSDDSSFNTPLVETLDFDIQNKPEHVSILEYLRLTYSFDALGTLVSAKGSANASVPFFTGGFCSPDSFNHRHLTGRSPRFVSENNLDKESEDHDEVLALLCGDEALVDSERTFELMIGKALPRLLSAGRKFILE